MKQTRRFALVLLPVVICACTSPKAKKKSSSIFSSSETSEQHDTSSFTSNTTSPSQDSSSVPTPGTSITSNTHAPTTAGTSVTSSSKPTTSSSSTTSTEPPVPSQIIDYVAFTISDLEVKSTKYEYVALNFAFADGIDPEQLDHDTLLEYESGTFATNDASIATVSEYGKVTGVNPGKTTITYTTKYNAKVATLNVYVYDDSTIVVRKWTKMGPTDTIQAGDQIIIGCPQEGKAASMDDAGHNRLDVVDVTYNTDQSEMTSTTGAGKFVVGNDYKGRGGFTLEIPERDDGRTYLCATNIQNIEFQKTAKTTQALWEIFYYNEDGFDDWIICSHVDNIDGAMMYNVTSPQFNLYQSNEIEHAMYYISVYKLVTSFQFVY